MAKAGKEQRYLVDTNTSFAQVVQERDELGILQARYLWEDGLAPLVQFRRTQAGDYAAFFSLCDGQDSVRQLTDAQGGVTDSYYYDAFGNALQGGTGTTPNPFRYTGQQDDGGGRYFLRARYYQTGTGRFLSHDPLMGSGGDPISLHRYLYGNADGIGFRDPSGRFSVPEMITFTAIAATLGILSGCNSNSDSSFYNKNLVYDLNSGQKDQIQRIKDAITKSDNIRVSGCKSLSEVCYPLFNYKLKMADDKSPLMKTQMPGGIVLAFAHQTPSGENYMAFSATFFSYGDGEDGDEKRARIIIHECLHHLTDLKNPGKDDNAVHRRLYGWAKFLSSQLYSKNDQSYIPSNLKECILNDATPTPDPSTQGFDPKQWEPYYGEEFLRDSLFSQE